MEISVQPHEGSADTCGIFYGYFGGFNAWRTADGFYRLQRVLASRRSFNDGNAPNKKTLALLNQAFLLSNVRDKPLYLDGHQTPDFLTIVPMMLNGMLWN